MPAPWEPRAHCARVALTIPGAISLKDRRSVTKSLIERLKGRFNLSVSDLDGGSAGASSAILGLATVSASDALAEQTLQKAIEFIEGDGRAEVMSVEISRI